MDVKVPNKDPLYIATLHERELKRLADLMTIEHTQVSRLMCGRFIRVGRDAFKITDITLTKTGSIMLRGVQAFSRRRKPAIIGPLSVGEIVTEKVARLIVNGRWGV